LAKSSPDEVLLEAARIMRRLLLVAAVATLAVVGAIPARAAGTATVTTAGFTYLAPLTVIAPGDGLMYANADVATHDLTSDASDPVTHLPLFSTARLAPGGAALPVTGVELLAPGLYQYHCTVQGHGFMHGALQVEAPPVVPTP
jgi:plastocyanin